MKKKLLCVLLAAVMMLSLLAACAQDTAPANGEDAEQTQDATPSPDATTPDDPDDPTEPEDPADRFAERISIELATTNVFEGYDYLAGDPYAVWFADEFNIETTFINMPFDVWISNLRLWATMGEMPEVAVWDYMGAGHNEGAALVEQGLLRRLPDDWQQRWPYLAASHQSSGLGPRLDEVFDGTYFLPRPRFHFNFLGDPLPNHESLLVRRDWFEAVGMPIRPYYTINEMMEAARLILEQDPGELGDMLLPITANTGRAAQLFVRSNFAHWDTFYRGPDGTYRWGAANERTREGLMLWYEAYSTGLLDLEFYLHPGLFDRELLSVAGRAGIVLEAAGTHNVPRRFYTYGNNFPDRDPHEDVMLATLLGTDGNYHQRCLINMWGAFMFSPRITDAQLERVLDILDWLASPEGNTVSNMGVYGVDWERDANGDIVSLLGDDEILMGAPDGDNVRNPSMGNVFWMPILQDDFQLGNPNLAQVYRDISAELYANRVAMSTSESFPVANWDLLFFDSDNMRNAAPVASAGGLSETFAHMVITATSMENFIQMYEDWMEQQMHLVQPVLDELNEMLG